MHDATQRMALAPLTLADHIPTIMDVLARRISGLELLPHPGKGSEFYLLKASVALGDTGPYIDLEVSEFGADPDSVRVFIHLSEPVK